MTTPQQPQPPQQPGTAADAAAVAAVAGVLLTATTVGAAMAGLGVAYAATRVRPLAMRAALGVVLSMPPGQEGFHGEAGRQVARVNMLRRAQFTVSAAHRLSDDITQAHSRRQPVQPALDAGVQREKRYYGMHLVATWARTRAGAQVDSAVMEHGRLVGWHATVDAMTSKECLAANGKNFYAGHMPVIGYPGAVHPRCRCQPGRPFPGGQILPSYGLAASAYRRAA